MSMCRRKHLQNQLSKVVTAAALSGALVVGLVKAPSARALPEPSGCLRGGLASQINVSPNIAHVGDLITITHLGVSLGGSACNITNGESYIVYPNGSNNIVAGPPTGTGLNGAQEYETNFTILQGQTLDCLNSPTPAAACSTVTLTYTVDAADENRNLSFNSPRGIGSGSVSGTAKTVKFLAYSDGLLIGTSGTLNASGQGNDSVLVITPCIGVTKNCTLPQGSTCFAAGQPVTFGGVVTNCGDTTLIGVTINDTQATNITFDATTSSGRAYDGTLTNGETIGYSGSYTPGGNPACTSVTNTVTAYAFDITGLGVTNTATAVCPICCPPNICVSKGITCAPPTFVPDGPNVPSIPGGIAGCGSSLSYGPSATGVAGPTNQTAFCYQIVVSNCGPDILTNVTVTDNLLTNVAGTFPTTLAVGESATNYYGDSFGLQNGGPSTNVNTVTATGTGLASGITTNATASATAIVLPISVSCQITLHSDFDQDANNGGADGSTDDNHVTLPAGSTNTPINFTEVITNPGPAGLNVTVTGIPPLVDCADTNSTITVLNPIFIPAGGSATITGCIIESCPGGSINVSVQGTAVANTAVECVFDANGNAVATASNTCSASVSCVQPVTCRVTGGGILMPNTSDNSCITVNTTILPLIVNGLPVNKITHGGELGAPFSQMDCGAILGNPCIRGQWQHTRHYVGKGNPRDVIDMDFHSATPKGVFDSLSCACLGCCDPTTGVFIPPTVGPLIHKFALCNPDDHSVCGPQPRPAPANAIIFSGVGTLTPTTDSGANGKAATWVVFRVYIEDRSEPGGFHPKGATEPADIYVFQAWNTGILVSKKPNFNGISTQFRKDLGQANCDFLDALNGGSLPIGSLPSPTVDGQTADIQDMGPLYSGNHQIHPSTGATCQ